MAPDIDLLLESTQALLRQVELMQDAHLLVTMARDCRWPPRTSAPTASWSSMAAPECIQAVKVDALTDAVGALLAHLFDNDHRNQWACYSRWQHDKPIRVVP